MAISEILGFINRNPRKTLDQLINETSSYLTTVINNLKTVTDTKASQNSVNDLTTNVNNLRSVTDTKASQVTANEINAAVSKGIVSRIQRGDIRVIQSGSSNYRLNIQAVNLNKALLIVTGTSTSTLYTATRTSKTPYAELENSNTILFKPTLVDHTTSTNICDFEYYWQVIEFN